MDEPRGEEWKLVEYLNLVIHVHNVEHVSVVRIMQFTDLCKIQLN